MKSRQIFLSIILSITAASCSTTASQNQGDVTAAPVSQEQKNAEAFDRLDQFHFREVTQLDSIPELQQVSNDQALNEFKAALSKKQRNSLHALFLVFDKDNSEVFISHLSKPAKKATEAEKSRLIQERLQALKNENVNASYGVVIFSPMKS